MKYVSKIGHVESIEWLNKYKKEPFSKSEEELIDDMSTKLDRAFFPTSEIKNNNCGTIKIESNRDFIKISKLIDEWFIVEINTPFGSVQYVCDTILGLKEMSTIFEDIVPLFFMTAKPS